MVESIARVKHIRVTPQKARRVVALIKGKQAQEALAKRRLGLGVTGLADALLFCGARYGDDRSVALTGRWLGLIKREAYRASAELAGAKGAFPLYDPAILDRPNLADLDAETLDLIRANGLRNGCLTSIAPTGTTSLLAGNVSSGIEPVFAYTYTRKILKADGTRIEEDVSDYAYRKFRALFGEDTALPDYFVNAQELSPNEHLAVQAAAQKYIDSSISKTINVPVDISFDAFKDVYRHAYDMGCKGCTTYRPSEARGSVLAVAPAQAPAPSEPVAQVLPPVASPRMREEGGVVYMTQPLDRPEVLIGQTYKIKWADLDHAFYITINDVEKDGRRRPFEIFINSKNMEHYAWTVALTRMISAVFRRGGDVSFVVDEMKAVFDPRGGQWMNAHYVPSILAAIGEVIERHLVAIGFMTPREDHAHDDAHAVAVNAEGAPARYCPRCGQPGLVKVEGCDTCVSCGYSRCG